MEERDFQEKCDAAMDWLRRRLLELSDQYPFEVEGEGEKLELLFADDEETRFVISPNSAARQIWISALTTSFKLSWSGEAQGFLLDKTREPLGSLMARILSQQLGQSIEISA
jgi:CyaY protein